jgi:hypothetical protein
VTSAIKPNNKTREAYLIKRLDQEILQGRSSRALAEKIRQALRQVRSEVKP